MIWLGLFIVCVIGLSVAMVKDEEGWIMSFAFIGIISCVALFFVVGFGVSCYPELLGDKEEIIILQNEIQTIREARYEEVKSGKLVAGSLNNMKQSTALSKYLSNYIAKKAKFNKVLKALEIKLEIPVYRWLGYIAFIDKRVKDIEPLK